MTTHDHGDGPSRRKVLECMTWAGTGVLWTISGGVPHSLGLVDEAKASEAMAAEAKGLTFLQISDSHMGFDKPANPNAKGTLEEAIARIKAIPTKPAFMIHTGDITHLSKVSEFDDAEKIISQAKLDVHYVPGEHDIIDPDIKLYKERYGRGSKGSGYYSFDANGVHFMGLVNVANLKGGGMGSLGEEQLKWIEDDLKSRSASTPIVVFVHIPLWALYPQWGWGTEDSAQALATLKRFGSVTVLNGHIHQVMQKVEGNVTFHTARSTAFPQPAPGTAPSPGPMKVPDDKLRNMLGTASVTFKQGEQRLAIIDTPLQSLAPHDPDEISRAWRDGPACCRGTGGGEPGAGGGHRSEDRQLHVQPAADHGEGRRHRHLGQPRRHPAHGDVENHGVPIQGDGHRRQVLVHIRDTGQIRLFLFLASAHDRHDCC